jgi:hypothetical protein
VEFARRHTTAEANVKPFDAVNVLSSDGRFDLEQRYN